MEVIWWWTKIYQVIEQSVNRWIYHCFVHSGFRYHSYPGIDMEITFSFLNGFIEELTSLFFVLAVLCKELGNLNNHITYIKATCIS